MVMNPLDELATLLRPAGGGLHLVSTGRAEQVALQQRLYGVATTAQVDDAFRRSLERLVTARGVVLGVPSDVGAGFQRGANLGPQAIRLQLLKEARWAELCTQQAVVDVGDVFVVPQLQHDDMLSAQQLAQSRAALYPNVAEAERERLPVSPLSIAERAWALMFQLNPRLKPFVIGGDHSTALPGVLALADAMRARGDTRPLGIVQPDAHTDLLEHRLGVKFCFATWSWHANERIGRQQRLVQVGTRASGRDQAHWEQTLQVRQFWAREILSNPDQALNAVLAHVRALGVQGIYFSNDIDGTDARHADATGTPEPGGLEPEWVSTLIRRLGAEVGLLGGDVMEVAPSLTRTPVSAERTVSLAARYFVETVEAAFS